MNALVLPEIPQDRMEENRVYLAYKEGAYDWFLIKRDVFGEIHVVQDDGRLIDAELKGLKQKLDLTGYRFFKTVYPFPGLVTLQVPWMLLVGLGIGLIIGACSVAVHFLF
jgi:hypothetical protein